MKYRFPILVFVFTVCSCIVANADTFTDGITKRVADGQIQLTLTDNPILDELFNRTYQQRKECVIEYLASIFRHHMTEKEFNAWMNYKPSKEETDYEERLKDMQDEVQKDQNVTFANLIKMFEVAYGIKVGELEDLVEKKRDYILEKYGHQAVDFNVYANGIKRVYK